jgi:hypothetical protein
MNALRRPEVVVLFAAVLVAIGWVVYDSSRRTHFGPGDQAVRQIEITKVQVTQDGTHRRLRVELVAVNPGSTPLEMRPPAVRLLDASGAQVPEFFQPGVFPPALPPATKAASWLEYWLTENQLAAPLRLEIDGQQVAVKL